VGTDDTCPQGSLSLLDHKVEVAVRIFEHEFVQNWSRQDTMSKLAANSYQKLRSINRHGNFPSFCL
jgi:hypothetical protein